MSGGNERNFLVGIFGENFKQANLIGQALGSPGTKSDIQFYNRLDAGLGHVFCALAPVDYPEKIKPFLQALSITSIHLLVIDLELGLNATIGELLVGIDLFHQLFETKALVIITGITSKSEWKLEDTKKKIEGILSTTSLKGTEIITIREKEDYDFLKKKVIIVGETMPEPESNKKSYAKVLIDHVFPVKGIGTVILGVVKKGIINASQMVEITGYNGPAKKVIIRSIQKHDRDFKIAYEGDRVGLALKGNIAPEDLSRDNIITTQGIFKTEKEINAKLYINLFYKPKTGKIKPGDGQQYHGLVEIKSSPLKFIKGGELAPGESGEVTISFENPLVHDGNGLRGIITELNKFENKLRIIGYFTQIIE